jgi:glutaredoxin 3
LDYKDKAVYYDVKADKTRMDEMLKYSGGDRRVPVIVEGDNITVGYGGS